MNRPVLAYFLSCLMLFGCEKSRVCENDFVLVLSENNIIQLNSNPIDVGELRSEFEKAAKLCGGTIMVTLSAGGKASSGIAIEVMEEASSSPYVHGFKIYTEMESDK